MMVIQTGEDKTRCSVKKGLLLLNRCTLDITWLTRTTKLYFANYSTEWSRLTFFFYIHNNYVRRSMDESNKCTIGCSKQTSHSFHLCVQIDRNGIKLISQPQPNKVIQNTCWEEASSSNTAALIFSSTLFTFTTAPFFFLLTLKWSIQLVFLKFVVKLYHLYLQTSSSYVGINYD